MLVIPGRTMAPSDGSRKEDARENQDGEQDAPDDERSLDERYT